MLKILFKLPLPPKRCLPVFQVRFFTVIDSKDDAAVPHSDDIVDDIGQFGSKIPIKG